MSLSEILCIHHVRVQTRMKSLEIEIQNCPVCNIKHTCGRKVADLCHMEFSSHVQFHQIQIFLNQDKQNNLTKYALQLTTCEIWSLSFSLSTSQVFTYQYFTSCFCISFCSVLLSHIYFILIRAVIHIGEIYTVKDGSNLTFLLF